MTRFGDEEVKALWKRRYALYNRETRKLESAATVLYVLDDALALLTRYVDDKAK